LVKGLLGTSGLPNTGSFGLLDLTPIGGLLGAQEEARIGDYQGAALAVMPGARAVPRLLGRFPTTQTNSILKATRNGGGYVNLQSGSIPQQGLMVRVFGSQDPRNAVIPISKLSNKHIEDYVRQKRQDPRSGGQVP
jgi:hypothetical protein